MSQRRDILRGIHAGELQQDLAALVDKLGDLYRAGGEGLTFQPDNICGPGEVVIGLMEAQVDRSPHTPGPAQAADGHKV